MCHVSSFNIKAPPFLMLKVNVLKLEGMTTNNTAHRKSFTFISAQVVKNLWESTLTWLYLFQVYGSIFFTTIVFSPIFGKYIEHIGSRNLFLLGTLIAGIANIGFGFLQWIDKAYPFLMLSLIIRIISAMGEAAFFTAVYPLTVDVRSFNDLFLTDLQILEIMFFCR